MNRYLTVLLALLLTLLSGGCDSESSRNARTLELQNDAGVPLGSQPGDRLTLPKENRDAVLVILKGVWPTGQDFSMELVRVIDSDVFVPQREDEGDPHWISRARVTNATGEVLWSQRINTLYQLLQFLNRILEDQDAINLSVQQVAGLVQNLYPELLEFAVKVPTGLEGGATYTIEIADEPDRWREVFSAPIDELLAAAEPPAVEAEVIDLVTTGPDEDRLTLVILGDGYRTDQRQAFELDAQAVADTFLATTPMAEHRDLFNIKAVWTPSTESGASYDCTSSNCEQGFKDTFFDTTFVIPALADRLNLPLNEVSDRVAMPIQIGKVFETAALGSYDDIVLISNSRKRSGFAGLYISLVTAFDARTNFPHVAVHELGHSLGLLGDEYMVPGDSCYYNEPLIPLPANIGKVQDNSVKWIDWLLENTPIPTPNSDASRFPVGAYQGAYNCDFLVRPSHRCKMNSSRDEFCSVCAEQMIRRFYSFVDPPKNEELTAVRVQEDLIRIRVPLRNEFNYEVIWSVDGVPIYLGETFSFRPGDLIEFDSNRWLPLDITVRNNTDFLRTQDEAVESTYHFEVRLSE